MPEPRRLIAIAHRAGNTLGLLRRAEAIGPDFVEADVRLYRLRLEVRHLKTMRWLPLLYDRHPWRLAPGWTRRLTMPELLAELAPETGLMVDLKGENEELPGAVLEAMRAVAAQRKMIVCGQNWRLVDPFVDAPEVTAAHSIGRRDQLDAFLGGDRRTEGVSIHKHLVTRETVDALHARAPLVVTWPINTRDDLERVAEYGVDGVTTDSLAILRDVVAGAPHAMSGEATTAPPGNGPARSP